MATDKGQTEAPRGHSQPALVADSGAHVDAQIVMMAAPRSPAAEQYRVLARRIEPAIAAGARRVAVVSAVGGEGRSTTAANLALALSLDGRSRVALVDAHLRAPSLHRLLAAPPGPGLVDLIEGRATLAASLWRVGAGPLELLAAGHTDAPHARMASPVLARVLGELAARCDVVIVDAPPTLPTADLLSFVGSVDAALLVVRAGRTPRDLIRAALGLLSATPLLGAVLHRSDGRMDPAHRLWARSGWRDPAAGAAPATREASQG